MIRFIACFMFLSLVSCFKEDEPILLPSPGDTEVFQVELGDDYSRQQYFHFNSGDTLGGDYKLWDLAFEADADGWHIWINGGNMALADNTGTQDFKAVTDTVNANWKWDETSWNIDSTAIGDWRMDRMVYVLDRGLPYVGNDRFRKIVFQEVDSSRYEFLCANLDGSNEQIIQVLKDENYAYRYFSFSDGGSVLEMEPYIYKWDILFTRYRVIFYLEDPPLPYLVSGVLLHPDLEVAIDSVNAFENISYNNVNDYNFTSQRDAIGYNWKYYDLELGYYSVNPNLNYILKDWNGIYWKLHFIGFYNEDGEKGYPQFAYKRL